MAYQVIHKIFQKQESDLTPAQAHGIATAMLCIDNRADVDGWLAEAFTEPADLLEQERKALIALFNHTRSLLNPEETEFRFDLFLPTDEDLAEQVIALSDWCQGFLWGIGYRHHSMAQWSKETHGILQDIVEFTKLDSDLEEGNDEDEEAFMQIHEYLRVAVLMIRDEFNQSHSEQIH